MKTLFCAQKPPIFGTKVDLFAIGKMENLKFQIQKKIILAELHKKKGTFFGLSLPRFALGW